MPIQKLFMANQNKFSLPRGTADILPQEVRLWQDIEAKARSLFDLYHYQEIRTPVFEETELFARSMGATSDVVQKQMLTLQPNQREGESGQSSKIFSLRPEGTASVVRSYIENSLDRKEALTKLFYIGPMFRGERPQKGRLRQFYQIGVEAIGPNSASPYLDAEIMGLSVALLKAFGVKDHVLKINTLGSLEDKQNVSTVLREMIGDQKASLCPTCQQRLDRNVFRVLDCKNQECQKIVAGLKLGVSLLSQQSQEYYAQVKKALGLLGVSFQEVPTLVRGLDYYTQVVFEITSPSLGSQDALGAGGRYNGLVQELGGSEGVDAVGFSLGMERIILARQAVPEPQARGVDVFVAPIDDKAFESAFQIMNTLRQQGLASDMSYKTASLKSQMRLADKLSARYVCILGEDEMNQNAVTLKDMTTGSQEKISREEIVEKIKKLVLT